VSTSAGELAAIRGVARHLGAATAPIEVRRARAWSTVLQASARNLGRLVEFHRANAEGKLPEVDPADETGYEGLDTAQAATRYASIAARLAVEGRGLDGSAAALLAERDRFVRHVDALNASRIATAGRGVARVSPGTSGAGLARQDGRDTSKLAALQALPASGRKRRQVLDAVAAVARDPQLVGLTDLQIAQATGLRDNSVRPRRVELVDGGWLEPATTSEGHVVTRQHYGREHTVWVLTQRAAGDPDLRASLGRA
jgi:hypothetical protein